MSCRPSKLRPGDRISLSGICAQTVTFVRREPAQCGRPARNTIKSPDWVGLDGPHDQGHATMSDYELSRRGTLL